MSHAPVMRFAPRVAAYDRRLNEHPDTVAWGASPTIQSERAARHLVFWRARRCPARPEARPEGFGRARTTGIGNFARSSRRPE